MKFDSNDFKLDVRIIINYIQNNNLTKKDFCLLCGISYSTLNRILNNKNFQLKALFRIARVIDIPVHMLFKKDG